MVLPVFIRQEDIPTKYQKDGLEICLAVASVVGNSTAVDGAQLKNILEARACGVFTLPQKRLGLSCCQRG